MGDTDLAYSVTVPAGCRPGDRLTVDTPQGTLEVAVPAGCYPGDVFEATFPTESPSNGIGGSCGFQHDSSSWQHEVVVPEGVFSGDSFVARLHGSLFEIVVPEGLGPGDALLCDLPLDDDHAEAPASPPESPALPHRSGVAATPEAWPARCAFSSGERVELMRADGSFSLGRVLSAYEGALGVLYQVRLDNGVYKQAVSEEELYRHSHADEQPTDDQARTLVMWQDMQMGMGD